MELCPALIHSERFESITPEKGCLYIVSTPIGNLEEISFRALKILEKVDLIACEDTRHTGMLLKHYGIKSKMVSFYSGAETAKADMIVENLRNGKSVALVSDAGTPCISDPGGILVMKCVEQSISVRAVPGSSSLIHALVMSGFDTGSFYFQGFLPRKKGRQSTLAELAEKNMLIVIFESPYRVRKTLTELSSAFGNREVSVSRELSKKFEQTLRGSLREISAGKFIEKGEFVIIINNIKNK